MSRGRPQPMRRVEARFVPRPAGHSFAGFIAVLDRIERRLAQQAAAKSNPEEALPCPT